MADDRTTVTELITGLGMLGFGEVDEALAARPAEMVSVSPERWESLAGLHRGGAYDLEFAAAWENGRAFLDARDGLRERRPIKIEWRGGSRQPGDEPVPADLRIDHVFLVSCKYLSKIVTNSSPAAVFDRLLLGGHGGRSADWYAEVAGDAYQDLYREVLHHLATAPPEPASPSRPASRPSPESRDDEPTLFSDALAAGPLGREASGPGGLASRASGSESAVTGAEQAGRGAAQPPAGDVEAAHDAAPERPNVTGSALGELPEGVGDLSPEQRGLIQRRLGKGRWPAPLRPAAGRFSDMVARASAQRWQRALASADPLKVLWRLLRIGSAPYFVLGSAAAAAAASGARSDPLRLRIGTAWDWRQQYDLRGFEVSAASGGQPVVRWRAEVQERRSREAATVEGHVEIRWSHGKFAQPPEAKVYLDTPHHRVPGYWPLA